MTERIREVALYDTLKGAGLTTLELIGDAAAPGLIADAVFAGHQAARNFERPRNEADQDWFRREITDLREERLKMAQRHAELDDLMAEYQPGLAMPRGFYTSQGGL